MHCIQLTESTWGSAQDAIRDILYMYWDMSQSGAFAHNTETGSFNERLWIDVALGSHGYGSEAHVALLQRGSAVKLLCALSDHLHEREGPPENDSLLGRRITEILKDGILDHLPTAKRALQLGTSGQTKQFWAELEAVYEEYVQGTYG